jgi:hypothetical protein
MNNRTHNLAVNIGTDESNVERDFVARVDKVFEHLSFDVSANVLAIGDRQVLSRQLHDQLLLPVLLSWAVDAWHLVVGQLSHILLYLQHLVVSPPSRNPFIHSNDV